MTDATEDSGKSQLDKFKEAARDLECDDERLKKLVKVKPAEKPGHA